MHRFDEVQPRTAGAAHEFCLKYLEIPAVVKLGVRMGVVKAHRKDHQDGPLTNSYLA